MALKYNATFELVQREIQGKREELAERFGMRNMLRSSSHARAIVELELSSLKKLLDPKLQAILEVYYKNSIPWNSNITSSTINGGRSEDSEVKKWVFFTSGKKGLKIL